MARASMIAKEKRRTRLCEQYLEQRRALKRLIIDPAQSDGARLKAMLQLQKFPKDSSKTRLRNRCAITGRARGYIRRFGICRIKMREMAACGEIPGIRMASW